MALPAAAQTPGGGADAGPAFVAGEVLVRFKASVPADRREAIRDAADVRVDEPLPLPGLQLLEVQRGTGVREAARELESRGAVAYAEPNFYRFPQATPDDTHYDSLWGLSNEGQAVRQTSSNPSGTSGSDDADIDAPEAWDLTTGSSDVTVAVVDSGVSYGHRDLAPNTWLNSGEQGTGPGDQDANGFPDDVRGWDFVDDDATPSDELIGHGTHVAGTIGAAGDNGLGVTGVNWDVSIMPLRVLSPTSGSVADIIAAFDYARDNGADVVNASFGVGGGLFRSEAEEQAIRSAPEVLFVAAAGNDGTDNDQRPFWPCSYPAPNLVCVAATDQNDALAGFSNTGRRSVDLGAPGVNTYSAREQPFFDDFERPIEGRWTTGGTSAWASTAGGNDPDPVLVDSPDADYADHADSYAQSPDVNLNGRSDCRLDYDLRLDVEAGESPDDPSFDYLVVEGSSDGVSWSTLLGDEASPDYVGPATTDAPGVAEGPVYTGAHSGPVSNDLSAFEGTAGVAIRFRLVSDEATTADGVQIDDVAVACRPQSGDPGEDRGYKYLSGTSMATPHVAGVAALALAHAPDASVLDLRAALLDGGDPLSSLSGKTVTGRRLNADSALGLAGTPPALPTATITGTPPDRTRSRTVSFSFTADNPDVEFRCQVDGRAGTACASPYEAGALADGLHAVDVSARRPGGGYGPSDRHEFLVDATGPLMGFPASVARMRRNGVTRVPLTCPAGELSGPCRGELRLRTKNRVRVGRRTKKLTLGKGSFTISPGATERVRVVISRRGRKVVEREPRLRVVGRAVARDTLGNQRAGSRVFKLRSP